MGDVVVMRADVAKDGNIREHVHPITFYCRVFLCCCQLKRVHVVRAGDCGGPREELGASYRHGPCCLHPRPLVRRVAHIDMHPHRHVQTLGASYRHVPCCLHPRPLVGGVAHIHTHTHTHIHFNATQTAMHVTISISVQSSPHVHTHDVCPCAHPALTSVQGSPV